MLVMRESVKSSVRYFYPLINNALLGYDWCGEFDCNRDFCIKRNGVDFFVLIYTISGKGVIEVDGKKYYASKNTLSVIGKSGYKYSVCGDEWKFKYVHVRGAIADEMIRQIALKNGIVFSFYDILGQFDKIMSSAKNLVSDVEVSKNAYSLLLSIYHGETNVTNKNSVIDKVTQYISDNLSGDLSVDVLANTVNLSRPYFSEVFIKSVGKSPSFYVLLERLKKARFLLCTTDMPILEIASACGYYDVSSFIRVFKKHEGVTPYAFRKKLSDV